MCLRRSLGAFIQRRFYWRRNFFLTGVYLLQHTVGASKCGQTTIGRFLIKGPQTEAKRVSYGGTDEAVACKWNFGCE
jgi:hypothetical protein